MIPLHFTAHKNDETPSTKALGQFAMPLSDQVNIGAPFAIFSAQAFAETGVTAYNHMVAAWAAKADAGQKAEPVELMRHAVPAVVNLAFSVELFVKLIAWQRTAQFPHGHDLAVLAKKIPADVLQKMDAAYSSEYARHAADVTGHGGLRISQFTFSTSGAAHSKPPSNTLQRALEDTKNAFIAWRYFFEQGTMTGGLTVDLRALVLMPAILEAEFGRFKGNLPITVGP